MTGTSTSLDYGKNSSFLPRKMRKLCAGPITQKMDHSQPRRVIEHVRRKD